MTEEGSSDDGLLKCGWILLWCGGGVPSPRVINQLLSGSRALDFSDVGWSISSGGWWFDVILTREVAMTDVMMAFGSTPAVY